MKLIFTILFFGMLNANATNYYVDNAGNDSNNGLTTGTAWQTITKINSSIFLPGDSILFKAGGTWNERLNVPSSGSAGDVITFGSYGTGLKPIITGFQTLSGFSQSGNVWTVTASNSVKQLNTVLVGGIIRAKARTPNTGYSTFTSNSGKTQITTGLTGTPNYTGAECVVRNAHWIIDVCKISSQSGGVLNFSNEMTYATPLAFGANGYFIQNVESALDIEGEWCYDSTTKVLKVYSTTSPTVQISTIDTLVHLSKTNYITFYGLSFTGANKAAFQIDTSRNITIVNCSVNYSGTLGISGLKSPRVTIENDSIQNSLSGAVYLRQVDPFTPTVNTCDSAFIDGNYIKNAGHFAGMGMNNNCRYVGVYVIGLNPTVTNNRLDSLGYIGIFTNGTNGLIQHNYGTNYCFTKDDGGFIYTVVGNYIPADYNDGTIINENIAVNGIGASAGTSTTSFAAGFYLDNTTNSVTVSNNTAYKSLGATAFLNETNTITFRENTLVNDAGACMTIYGSNAQTFGMDIKRNAFYSQSTSQYILYRELGTNLPTTDSNYYSRPLNELNSFRISASSYSLSGWKTAISQDVHSVGTPFGTNTNTPIFHYNPTSVDSTIILSGTYIDLKGRIYINKVKLHPFTSIVLYYAITQLTIQSVQNFKFYKGSSL